MFTSNPFAELSAFISPAVMQTYIVVMILMVAGGTLFDMLHKKSATYFFRAWRQSRDNATRQLDGGEMTSLAIRTAVVEVLTSGEFCKVRRRIAHLLTFYGFLAYIITTVIMVFSYPTLDTPAPAIVPVLWNIGALMVLGGGYWFWFFPQGRRRLRGQFAIPPDAGRLIRGFASGERDPGPGLGVGAGDRQHRVDKRVPGSVYLLHDGAFRVGSVVQVFSYVLQARSGLPEKGGRGERLEQPAAPRPKPHRRSVISCLLSFI